MNTLWRDLRYGARMLLNKPSFAIVAVVTLALGIGATTAIFSAVNAVLLRPLPYPNASRLVYVGQRYSSLAGSGEPKFLFWRERAQSFEDLAATSNFGGAGGNLAGGDEPEYVTGLRVSEGIFRVLGVYPALGRPFAKEDDTPGSDRVAILSDGLWRRRFHANPDILGQTVSLNDRPATVVGVMPPNFRIAGGADLFVPMQAKPQSNVDPNAEVIGRLKPGVALEDAQSEMTLIAEEYRAAFPGQMRENESIGVLPYQEMFTADVSLYLWILLGAVGFLLLIGCANVANLQLTRAAARRREIAVRMALGAGTGRITRQLVTEALLLSFIGGGAGLVLAVWGTEALTATLPKGLLPGIAVIDVDWHVLGFAFAAAALTGLLFGLAPVWQSRKVDVNSALKENAGKGTVGHRRLRGALVVAEIALSLVLLVGAGLLARTFANLVGVAPGFDPHNVLTCRIALNGERYDTTIEAAAFYRDALERVSHLPGVESAAVINKLPLDWQFNMPVAFPEQPDRMESVQFRMISPEYFQVMKMTVQLGRVFSVADDAGAPPVAIVNEAFVRRFFKDSDPFSRQLSIGRGLDDPARRVVGVVSDAKQMGLDRPALATVFVPIPQLSNKFMATLRAFTMANLTVRTTVPPLRLAEAVKREIAALDPTIPVSDIASMEEVTAASVAAQRFNMLLVGQFAVLGLVLAAVGIYGVVSYVVAQRTNEIGLRMALGAQGRDVFKLIAKFGAALAVSGVIAGSLASLALTRLMKGFLFGVSPTDPVTLIAIALLLLGVAMIACWIPARRAS
ncbi:MAG TPA: ABC transporter permease, partial [Blastocatellia bacterium]|nr:ABC transporter permease [Blastocatellia bacterium]